LKQRKDNKSGRAKFKFQKPTRHYLQ